jgi:hypothetical protein
MMEKPAAAVAAPRLPLLPPGSQEQTAANEISRGSGRNHGNQSYVLGAGNQGYNPTASNPSPEAPSVRIPDHRYAH